MTDPVAAAIALLEAMGHTVLPPPPPPPTLAEGQTWTSGNGDSVRSILSLYSRDGSERVVYGWHTDGEEYDCTARQFLEWIAGTRAELSGGPGAA